MSQLSGYLRLAQIIGDKKRDIPALIPLSKTTWYAGINSGRFPKPIKFSRRVSLWRLSDIQRVLDEISKDAA